MSHIASCHSERSEESLVHLSADAPNINQRCFAPLNMTKKTGETWKPNRWTITFDGT
jgi:hypothetical protein